MFRCALLLVLFLSGCYQPGADRAAFNPHTGMTTHRSQTTQVYRTLNANVQATAVQTRKADVRRYAVIVQLRYHGPNFPQIKEVWSNGARLEYEKLDRRYANCFDYCLREEVGAIHLSQAAFLEAALNGLALGIYGPRGAHEFTLPARLFQDASSPM